MTLHSLALTPLRISAFLRIKNPSFEVLRAFCKVLNLSLDSLMNLDLPEDEQSANDMRQLYLSCPPAARKCC